MLTEQNEKKEISARDRFRDYASKKSSESNEGFTDYLKRNVQQQAARTSETILGMPGAMKKAFRDSTDYLRSFLPQIEGTDAKGLEESVFGKPEEGSWKDLFMNPPTPSEVRERMTPTVAKNTSGREDYLEPKSEGEKFLGDLNQDITSFFMPGTGQTRMAVRLGAPILGNLAKEGLKYVGADESTAEKAKLGVMLATTIAGHSNPGEFAGQRIQQAKSMIPEGTTVPVGNLATRLMPLYNRMMRGLGVPSKSRATQGMKDLADQVTQGDRISLRSLMDARDNVNEWIAEAGGWDVPGPIRDATLRNMNELKRSIIDTVNENMAQRFPEAGELYKTGYEAAAVTHRSNAISSFIEKHFGRKAASVGAKILFPSIAGGAAFLPKTAGLAAAAYPLYKTGQILYRIAKSPTLAQYYQQVLTHAAQANAPAMVNSLDKLDKELLKDEKKKNKGKTLEEFKSRFQEK